MNDNPKRTAAIGLLVAKGIWPVDYVPMGLRLLWQIGIDVRPPYFASFWSDVIWGGSIPSLIFALIIWGFPFLRHQDNSIVAFAIRIGVFWFVMGLTQAFSNKRLRRKHNLPSWDDLAA